MAGVAIVTGGSRGIGSATAVALAEQGRNVVISYLSDEDAANTVVTLCEKAGVRAVAVQADVASESDVLRLFTAADELGDLVALVNNAGISAQPTSHRVEDIEAPHLERLIAVNVFGSFLCAREAVRRMSTVHGGSGGAIVNVSSALSRLGGADGLVDYSATKGAIDTMTLGLGREVAGEGIRVNAVRPGLIATEIHARMGDPGRAERVGPTVPIKRAGEPREVADVIAWLCSDLSSYVTAAIIDVSGGR